MKQMETYEDELYQEAYKENRKLRSQLKKVKKLGIKQKRELKYLKYAY